MQCPGKEQEGQQAVQHNAVEIDAADEVLRAPGEPGCCMSCQHQSGCGAKRQDGGADGGRQPQQAMADQPEESGQRNNRAQKGEGGHGRLRG